MTVANEDTILEFIDSARYGDLDDMKQLLERNGPSLFKGVNYSGNTALHMASANGHTDVVEFLLSRPEFKGIDCENESGNTALHWAAVSGSLEVAKLLTTSGANVLKKNKLGKTAFYDAKQAGHDAVADLLLDLIEEAEPEETAQD